MILRGQILALGTALTLLGGCAAKPPQVAMTQNEAGNVMFGTISGRSLPLDESVTIAQEACGTLVDDTLSTEQVAEIFEVEKTGAMLFSSKYKFICPLSERTPDEPRTD